jgi:hypothetical protein
VLENLIAFLQPGGQQMAVGQVTLPDGSLDVRTVLVSNLDALLYLGVITGVLVVLAGAVLRRRDL